MLEELLEVEGHDIDLRQLSESFPSKTPRIEKRKIDGHDRYFLILESETARNDEDVLAEGKRVLAEMNAIMLRDGPGFERSRIKGISKKTADGSLVTHVYISISGVMRTAAVGTPTIVLVGTNGEIKITENNGPTDKQVIYELGRNNEPLRRAWLIYGSLEHTWPNLYKIIEAIEDGNGGEKGLIAKNFVPGSDIKNFKNTANSWPAIGMDARHASPAIGSPTPKITLQEAQEMFRNLFEGWIAELKRNQSP